MKKTSKRRKNKGGWTQEARYNHYVKVVEQYKLEHGVDKLKVMSKKKFKETVKTLNEAGMTKIDYKRDIVEMQVYSELDKKASRKLYKMVQKSEELKKTALGKMSMEEIGQKGIWGLGKRQRDKVGKILSETYDKAISEGMTSTEAKNFVSSYYFGS